MGWLWLFYSIRIKTQTDSHYNSENQLFYVAASNIFPGPHTADINITTYDQTGEEDVINGFVAENEDLCQDDGKPSPMGQRKNDKLLLLRNITDESIQPPKGSKKQCPPRSFVEETQKELNNLNNMNTSCVVEEKFIRYYFLLLFLICFLTPVLITISLNFFISLAVREVNMFIKTFKSNLTLMES